MEKSATIKQNIIDIYIQTMQITKKKNHYYVDESENDPANIE